MTNNCGSGTDNSTPDLTSENLPDEFEFDQSILVGHNSGDNGEVEGTLDVSNVYVYKILPPPPPNHTHTGM
jgi:hypothetical protein